MKLSILNGFLQQKTIKKSKQKPEVHDTRSVLFSKFNIFNAEK